MNKELIKSFYTLRSALLLVDKVRTDGGAITPYTLEEYTDIMKAYHSIQGAMTKIYRRESEFFDEQSS
jgi:hypothetical protein